MLRHLQFVSLLAVSPIALAVNVAVVDSGTFFSHEHLRNKAWINPSEIVGNMVDDDSNGKVDDINGWNFANSLPTVFYPEHISKIDAKVFPIFNILAKIRAQTLTDEEKIWWQNNFVNLPKPEKDKLIANLNFYGMYAHGTHCSGIIGNGASGAKIMSARIFPDSEPPQNFAQQEGLIYEAIAIAANKQFADAASYLAQNSIAVANYSVGVPMDQIARKAMALTGKKNPSNAEVANESKRAFASFDRQGKQWMASSPNTLFVIAAANDGRSNADIPIFPANVQAPNAITIAATNGYSSLADFSNWDPNTVHVAAPGVNIMSTVPGPLGNEYLPMSGTSMAAPFVSMVASNVKDANPSLTPTEIRAILIGTVDKKDWLASKVSSSGIVNKERAVRAATLALSNSISSSIEQARAEVSDVVSTQISTERMPNQPTRDMLQWARKFVF